MLTRDHSVSFDRLCLIRDVACLIHRIDLGVRDVDRVVSCENCPDPRGPSASWFQRFDLDESADPSISIRRQRSSTRGEWKTRG